MSDMMERKWEKAKHTHTHTQKEGKKDGEEEGEEVSIERESTTYLIQYEIRCINDVVVTRTRVCTGRRRLEPIYTVRHERRSFILFLAICFWSVIVVVVWLLWLFLWLC